MGKMIDAIPLTESIILELLGCRKIIVVQPKKKVKQNGKHTENAFDMKEESGAHSFTVFMRQNTELPEDFSVGCVWNRSEDKSLLLTRYNGNHGEHKNFLTGEKFEGFHIHTFSTELYQMGISPLNNAIVTDKYASLNEALYCFSQDLNIANVLEFFPELAQGSLL